MAFVATGDGERAKRFYAGVLGLRLVSDDQFAVVFDANGTTLRIQKVKQPVVPPYTVLGWVLPDIRAAIGELLRGGVAMERVAFLPQDETGIWTAPNGDRVAWFKDPDGNTLSLTQFA